MWYTGTSFKKCDSGRNKHEQNNRSGIGYLQFTSQYSHDGILEIGRGYSR